MDVKTNSACDVNKTVKKVCLSNETSSEAVEMVENNDNQFEPVLEDIFTDDVSTIKVYIASIKDKKIISKYIQDINKILPLLFLSHLKRVRNSDILICPVIYSNPEQLLKDKGFNLLDSIRITDVPNYRPKTRKQYEKANKIWPVNRFREDKYLEDRLSGKLFINDKLEHEKYMRIAIEAARRSEVKIGAVMVDPKDHKILAVAGDYRLNHALKHATIVAIDLIARTQGGGSWDVEPLDYFFENETKGKPDNVHKKRNTDDDVSKPDGPYLCTGYDLYVTSEPCTVCAMALLHSRIRRVFYGCTTGYGAFGTISKVHILPETNHRFEVYRGLLKNECATLL